MYSTIEPNPPELYYVSECSKVALVYLNVVINQPSVYLTKCK